MHSRVPIFYVLFLKSLPFVFSFYFFSLEAHEGHLSSETGAMPSWIAALGNYHRVILHFPIALIFTAGFTELLALKYKTLHTTARFLIALAAISTIPTVLFGLAHAASMHYAAHEVPYFWWHRFLGLATPFLAFLTLLFKELQVKKKLPGAYYGLSLCLLMGIVTFAGYTGGVLTFNFPNEA